MAKPCSTRTTDRIGEVSALGLDEVLMVRIGPFHRQHFSTQIVDVRAGQLLDVVPGRGSAEPMAWLAEQTEAFRERIEFGTLDLSGPYRRVFEIMVPDATLVADPFHVVQARQHQARRVPTPGAERDPRTPGPQVRSPLSLPTPAHQGQGAPRRQRATRSSPDSFVPAIPTATWPRCGRPRKRCASSTPTAIADLALEWVTQLGDDLQDTDYPIEARSLGRTLIRWKHQIAAWHHAHVTNGPTEAVNNLIKRVKRAAFGFTSFRNYRIRSLLYAGKPNWDLLATVTPR